MNRNRALGFGAIQTSQGVASAFGPVPPDNVIDAMVLTETEVEIVKGRMRIAAREAEVMSGAR